MARLKLAPTAHALSISTFTISARSKLACDRSACEKSQSKMRERESSAYCDGVIHVSE